MADQMVLLGREKNNEINKTKDDLRLLLEQKNPSIRVIAANSKLLDRTNNKKGVQESPVFNLEDIHMSNSKQSPLSFEHKNLIDLCHYDDMTPKHPSKLYPYKNEYHNPRKPATTAHSPVNSQRLIPHDDTNMTMKTRGKHAAVKTSSGIL